MRLSTVAFCTLFLCFLFLTAAFQRAQAQTPAGSVAQQEVYRPATGETSVNTFRKFISVHVSPTKAVAGELPVMLGVRVSASWVIEAGAGPTFRDRVAQKLFDGKTLQQLPFLNRHAVYKPGYACYAGARYLIDKDVLRGFYVNPEIAFLHRNVSYPTNRNNGNGSYKGASNDVNVRLMLGYDRAWCGDSKHLVYGAFLGFGMRRYAARYYTSDVSYDPGVRRSVETIPTLHFGYRVGYKF